MAKMDVQQMRQEIEHFLATNPQPSDEQFHEFARSQGYDPETLESVAYEMLSGQLGDEPVQAETLESDEFDDTDSAIEAHMMTVASRLKVSATSTHFETGEGGEYGEDRPDAEDMEAEDFDLAVGAPESKPVEPEEPISAWDEAVNKAEARLRVTAGVDDYEDPVLDDFEIDGAARRGSKFADDTLGGFEIAADVGAPGDDGLSEQQLVLQGDENPQVQDSNSITMTDGAPVGQNSDDQTQDNLMVDGPVAEAALHDSADQAFMLNDGQPALQLRNASVAAATRLKASAFQ